MKSGFKGATKLYFTHYSCVVIVLFNKGLYSSVFSTILLENQSFCLSAFFVFSACSEFDVMFMNFCNICITTIHIVDVRYSVFLFSRITFRVLLNRAPTSTQLHPPPPCFTQLHLPPPSSFQPPPSSTHLHSAQLSLHPGHYNSLNNI